MHGRDFTADGTIQAAEIREGDPSPTGSGTLTLARGVEMGHIFQLGTKYAEALGLKVLDENGKLVTVTMGSYGVGVTRAVGVVAEDNHDELGLVWPRELAPFDVHVVAATGQVIGGVSPVGHPAPLVIVIDESLRAYPDLYAAAGTHDTLFRTDFEALVALTGARIVMTSAA